MKEEYFGHQRPGLKQLLCAWVIVLTVATIFRITDLLWPNGSTHFLARVTHLAQTVDLEQGDDVERWERGVPRQPRITQPGSRENILLSRLDQ